MNSVKEVDVLVIGAGPAGSMAAREASRGGAMTLIVDKKSEIGTPKRCGEGIMDGVLESVDLDVDERCIARHIDGARLVSPNGTSAWFTSETLETPATGIILERKVFDKHVTMDAIRSGAEVMLKCEATGMRRDGDCLLVDIEAFNSEYSQVRARIVIGADGPEGRVAGWLGIDTKVALGEMESGVQYEMTNLSMEKNDVIEFYFGSVAPGGYAWIFPKGYDIANVGIDVSGVKGSKTAIEYLDDFVKSNPETRDGEIVEVNVGANPLCGVFDKIIADNFILVGDAAGCVSPITGGGIDTALESGMVAGRVAARAVGEDDVSEANLVEYSDYVEEHIAKKFRKLINVRDFIYNLDDDDMDEYIGAISRADISKLSTKALLKAMIKVSPRKLLKLRKLL
ncbi:MAG: digeranylgeranylglycerophospholipid reductase [Methanosphaera sp. rholeuAM270]|nr:MAG: digeranylgeranylglycerophospholipid reductase [Methanosphaera sp. rholeuAM270]